jgi:hypothetical protein
VIRRIYTALPGPAPVKILESMVLILLLLVALHFFYSWLGNTFLDPGGAIG